MNLEQALEKNKALISWRSSQAEPRLEQKIFPHHLMNLTGKILFSGDKWTNGNQLKVYICVGERVRDIEIYKERERESADV